MESLDYQQKLKEKFFAKKLSTEEWAIFTKLMSSNNAFAEDVAFEIELRETLDDMNQYDLVKDIPTKSPNDEALKTDNTLISSFKNKLPYFIALILVLMVSWVLFIKNKNQPTINQATISKPDTPSVFSPILPKDSVKKDTPPVINKPLKDKNRIEKPVNKKTEKVNNDSMQFVQWVEKNAESWETAGVNEFYQRLKEAQYNEAYEMGIKLFGDNKINNNPRMAYTIGVIALFLKKDNEQAIKFFEIANKDATYQDIAKEYFELAIARQKKK